MFNKLLSALFWHTEKAAMKKETTSVQNASLPETVFPGLVAV